MMNYSESENEDTQHHFGSKANIDFPASIERIASGRWENGIAQDHARVHNGHVFIQNQYDSYDGGARKCSQARDQRLNFLDALEFDCMESRYESISAAHVDTCQWLFHKPQYTKWRNHSYLDTHHGFLWIKGKAGCGKSTLMKCALVHAEEHYKSEKIISFFFHARGEELEKSVEGMYRSLLAQMLRGSAKLRSMFPTYCPTSVKRHGWTITTLQTHFSKVISHLDDDQAVTIYVDALDECDEHEIREAVEHFEELGLLALSKNKSLHVCFASRHYPRVTIRQCVQLDLEKQSEHRQDIRRYIDHKLALEDVKFKEDLASKIEARSSGVFFWVVLVIRMIRVKSDSGASKVEIMRALQDLPVQLQEMIQTVLHLPDEAVICTMRWLIFASNPLSLEELYFAIRIGTNQLISGIWNRAEVSRDSMEAFILASSRGLVEQTPNGRVELIHESVREYLLAVGLPGLGPCSDERVAADSHAKLYKCCREYLILEAHEYVHGLGPIEIGCRPMDDHYPVYPFAWYASYHVFHHLEASRDANLLIWKSLCDFPLEPLLARRNFVSRLVCKQLFALRHHPIALLYLFDRELAKAFLAVNAPAPVPFDDENLVRSVPSSERFFRHRVYDKEVGPESSLLELAATRYPDVVRYLMNHGADVNVDQGAPLCRAVACSNAEIVDLLSCYGACIDGTSYGKNPLTIAVKDGDLAMVKLLLTQGANPNGSRNRSVKSPLLMALGQDHEAVSYGSKSKNEAIMHALLEYGADTTLGAGANRLSPLQFAVDYRSKRILQLLLERRTQNGREALDLLIYAAGKLKPAMVEVLLEKVEGTRARTQALRATLLAIGCDMLDLATWRQRADTSEACSQIVQMLLDAGAEIEKIANPAL